MYPHTYTHTHTHTANTHTNITQASYTTTPPHTGETIVDALDDIFEVVRGHWESGSLNLQRGSTMKVVREEHRVRGRTHENHTQVIGLLTESRFQQNEEKVNLLTALMTLIHDYMRYALCVFVHACV
jgi:hypothetical protein